MDPQNQPAPAADNTPTNNDSNENDEWALAEMDFAAEKGHEVKDVKKTDEEEKPKVDEPKKDEKLGDEAADAVKKAADDAAAKAKADAEEAEKAKDETPDQTKARHEKEAADKKEAEELAAATNKAPEADQSVRDQRAVQRELVADERAMKADIKEKMFSDLQTELTDADGDPIRTIEDVMKLHNPNTGKPFTEEEAGAYLLQAQRHLDKQLAETEAKIQEIAEVNLTLKDDADTVRAKYGELFKAFSASENPALKNLQKDIWDAYNETLIKDEASGVIVKAPVSMQRFYDTALAGYVKLAQQLEAQAKVKETPEQPKPDPKADEKKKPDAEAKRKKDHSDREDIFSNGKSDTTDPEDKEWGAVAKDYYENN